MCRPAWCRAGPCRPRPRCFGTLQLRKHDGLQVGEAALPLGRLHQHGIFWRLNMIHHRATTVPASALPFLYLLLSTGKNLVLWRFCTTM